MDPRIPIALAVLISYALEPVVAFLGLLLWTWVWGGWGTILAVPMITSSASGRSVD